MLGGGGVCVTGNRTRRYISHVREMTVYEGGIEGVCVFVREGRRWNVQRCLQESKGALVRYRLSVAA